MQIQKINKNIKFSFINYAAVNLLKFSVRMVFLSCLSIEYLGINGLFANVLAMLSLAELGVGPAIVYSLYRPLALSDKETVKSIMKLFKKVYISIGIVIFAAGLCLTPWISYLIKDAPAIDDLELFYLIFLCNTAVSYFWSYKRNLLIADQKQYFVNIYQAAAQIITAVLQIIFLLIMPGYTAFVVLMLLGTILENVLISNKADKEYPYMKETAAPISAKTKHEIAKNTKAMIFHKLGGAVVFSSANIVISKFVGLAAVGLYSNYFMVISALNTFACKFFESITASIGNSMVTDGEKEKIKYFKVIEFITAFQASLTAIGLYTLFNPLIELWLGKKFLFDDLTVSCIVAAFYLTYMRKAVIMFRDACGLFWHDRYKPVAESVINLSASVYLAVHCGTVGVICGGIISTLATCFWVEPYILFRYGLKLPLKKYFADYLRYSVLTVFLALAAKSAHREIFADATVLNFIFSMLGIICFALTAWAAVFHRRDEFLIIKNMVCKKLHFKNK